MARRRILILAGPTREYIDPVRYLSNASSGRQGIALAEEALGRGHQVALILGPVEMEPPSGVRTISVVSADEMLERSLELHPTCDVLISAAAVSDYRPSHFADRKHKRESGAWTLELLPNTDILEKLGERKGHRVHVGFALETENLLENSRRKLRTKGLDWIVANSPKAIEAAYGVYTLLGSDGSQRDLGRRTKRQLASALLDLIAP